MEMHSNSSPSMADFLSFNFSVCVPDGWATELHFYNLFNPTIVYHPFR